MKKGTIIAIVAVGGLLFAGSLASAQYYSQYGYSYPTQGYSYQYPQYGQYGQASCGNPYPYLTIGSRGAQVIELQRFLAAQGYYQPVTGYYGTVTAQNVAAYQQRCGGYGYPTGPSYRVGTFRLGHSFALDEGEAATERNGTLTVRLDRIGEEYYWYTFRRSDDTVRVTLSYSCRPGTYCFYAPSQSYTLEEDDSVEFMGYEVEVTDIRADRATFIVRDEDDDDDDDDARITVTEPGPGDEFEQGDEMTIEWRVEEEPRNTSIILDLYDEDDDRVGTIAIVEADDDDFEWDIPEPGGFCTQQFPNELCGYDLEGDYYIKARLVEGNGFDSGRTLDEDDSAEFSIED